jgi:hypothetical protein
VVRTTGADIDKDFGVLNMAKIPNIYRRPANRPMGPFRPRKPRFMLHPNLILIPLVLIFAAWLLNRIRPSITWYEIFIFLGIRDYRRASMVVVLGLTLLAILLIKKILTRNKR